MENRNSILRILTIGAISLTIFSSCAQDNFGIESEPEAKKVKFDVKVTREGTEIPGSAITRGTSYESEVNKIATMNTEIPFGLIAVDPESETVIIDNQAIHNYAHGGYTGLFDAGLWEIPVKMQFSAYYPHVEGITYSEGKSSYSIPYSAVETEAGPLVSKTVERAIQQLNTVPFEFQHITNDIGFKIADVTPDKRLQGLIHLRKVTAYKVASAGVFVNDLALSHGVWHKQAYFRNVVVFEGDELVGVGEANEKFIGRTALVDKFSQSYRYYAIPDEIKIGKQFIKVEYDIDSFTLNGFEYPRLEGVVAKFMLYGVLPDNVMVYGRQYTFHLGLDLSSVYSEITFSPSVSEWETRIYENNDIF